jgi:4a-hydroxytetrahydrobiopterin dehydratase
MEILTTDQLIAKKCVQCAAGTAPYSAELSQQQLVNLPGWKLGDDKQSIFKTWIFSNFLQGLEFCNQVGSVAEEEQHHPDLHLTDYRHVRIDLATHSIDGLSESDFILAAKINSIEPQ